MVNLTRCLVYWDDSSVTQCLETSETSQEKQTNTVVLVGLFRPKTVPKLPVNDRASTSEHMGVQRSYPCTP